MYNDENNLYHYTYRKDGTEPGQRYDAKQPSVDEQINSYRQQQAKQVQSEQQAQSELEGQSQPDEEFTVPDFDGYGYDYGG